MVGVPTGNPNGRPSLYKPEYCQMLIDDMRDGFSLSAFAGKIEVARSTINEWIANHPEFSEAVSIGKAIRLRSWETQALSIARDGGGTGSSTMTIFGLKNMGGEEWREKQEVQHSGTIGLGDLVAASYKKGEPESDGSA